MWFLSWRKTRRGARRHTRRCFHRPRLEALEDRCQLSAGALDPTFGNGAGYVTTPVSNATIVGRQTVLLQPDGKIIDVGVANNFAKHGIGSDFAVVRYNSDGSLDTSFGSAGLALVSPTSISSRASIELPRAALYPNAGTSNDGKIVVEGSYLVTQGKNQNPLAELALLRFNSNGTLDTTFGSGGEVLTSFAFGGTKGNVYSAGVVVTSTGQIVEGGKGGGGTVLARFNANGTLDTTFGQGGKVITAGPQAQNLIQQSNGQLLAVGWDGNSSGTVVRYTANGTLDTTFGSGGVVTNPAFGSGGVYGVAVYPAAGTTNDGKIVVAGGSTSSGWEIARYNPDGTLDSTFGSGGMANPQTGPAPTTARGVALQADGKVVVSGDGSILVRYNSDGSLDATFGTGGIETTTVPATSLTSVVIQTNGDIVSAGEAPTFLVARFLPSEPQIGSFTANPNPVTSGSSVTLNASNITDGNAGASITQVTFYYFDSTGIKVTLGNATQTSPGVWTLTFTVNLSAGNYTIYAHAEDSYGVFGDPLALSVTVQ